MLKALSNILCHLTQVHPLSCNWRCINAGSRSEAGELDGEALSLTLSGDCSDQHVIVYPRYTICSPLRMLQ